MRQRRSKAYRKLMSMFSTSFGFRQPYQVLVDSTMCEMAISSKMDLAAQIESVLVGSVKLMITQCCIHELYLQGKSHQPAVDLAKSFERRKCNHKEAIPGDECIVTVVGDSNTHRYVIATQSHPLRVSLRAVPGVPIVHVNRAVMVLEPASDATLRAKHFAEQEALAPSTSERAILNAPTPQLEPVPKKKRGPKAPNPLSVKKKAHKYSVQEPKKIKPVGVAHGGEVEARRKRRYESDSNDEASPKPKRRRRRKSHSKPQEENV
ncbi:Fcf1-domain-containing protein [Lactarius indigo]|nr:Fcf1-domain-containing protein [Lactarius indigo]